LSSRLCARRQNLWENVDLIKLDSQVAPHEPTHRVQHAYVFVLEVFLNLRLVFDEKRSDDIENLVQVVVFFLFFMHNAKLQGPTEELDDACTVDTIKFGQCVGCGLRQGLET
jgi:hypothetical protein